MLQSSKVHADAVFAPRYLGWICSPFDDRGDPGGIARGASRFRGEDDAVANAKPRVRRKALIDGDGSLGRPPRRDGIDALSRGWLRWERKRYEDKRGQAPPQGAQSSGGHVRNLPCRRRPRRPPDPPPISAAPGGGPSVRYP